MTEKPETAIVTGASAPNGIGAAVARRLAADGYTVIVTDLAAPNDTAEAIGAAGGKAFAIACDVTDAAAVAACVQAVLDATGRIDVLVNNAGTTVGTGPFLDASEDDWTLSYRVNLLGPMLFSKAVIPAMRDAGGGSIVNIGSIGSLGADAGFGAYTAMKHGLIGLTKTVAAEFGPDGIRCNAVCPGFIATDMHEGVNARLAAERGIDIDTVRTERYAAVALRRAGTPNEVAETVAHLASPGGAYTTGVAIPVAGGLPVGL